MDAFNPSTLISAFVSGSMILMALLTRFSMLVGAGGGCGGGIEVGGGGITICGSGTLGAPGVTAGGGAETA